MLSCQICEIFKNIYFEEHFECPLLYLLSHFWIMNESKPNTPNAKIGVGGTDSAKEIKRSRLI